MSDTAIVESIFFAALEQPTADDRVDYLSVACKGDAKVRRQVERLLRAHENMGTFLAKPAAEQFAHTPPQSDTKPPARDTVVEHFIALHPVEVQKTLAQVDHYRLLDVLGQGGCGMVFRAMDEVLEREVAVKVLAPNLAAIDVSRESFLAEARAAAKIRHENVVQVYAVAGGDLPYLVMELVPGENLQQYLNRRKRLDAVEVAKIGRQIAEALAASHALGLIHRDVKPENILLETGSANRRKVTGVKIGDFGLARASSACALSQFGFVAGTPAFMSPEQAKGEPLDHRSDLFSLGSVLYTMCCGEAPFQSGSTVAVLQKVVEEPPPPIRHFAPEAPDWLCEIIERLHAKQPDERFASAHEVARLFKSCLSQPRCVAVVENAVGKSLPPQAGPAAQAVATPARASPGAWVAVAAMLLAVMTFGFSEAAGVTDFHETVIRLFAPEGVLIVEVADPGVSVSIDGSDLVVTGAGAKEIRLKVGHYTVLASKDGQLVQKELVSVTQNGRPVVRISQEANPIANQVAGTKEADRLTTDAWRSSLGGLPRGEINASVTARLELLNPSYDSKSQVELQDIDFIVNGGVRDISPIQELVGVGSLFIRSELLTDLSPLSGLNLHRLVLDCPRVTDLSPLAGMQLMEIDLSGCGKIKEVSVLQGMPLEQLTLAFTSVLDLTPLAGSRLEYLNCDGSPLMDLTPLNGVPLRALKIQGTQVTNLAALQGMPLQQLNCDNSLVSDDSVPFLKSCTSLKHLSLKGTKLSAGNIAALKQALPECEILAP